MRSEIPPAPGYDLNACRRRIPLLASLIPMNNCSQAPLPVVERTLRDVVLQARRADALLHRVGRAESGALLRASR